MPNGTVSLLQTKLQSDPRWPVCRSDELSALGSLRIRYCLTYFIVPQLCPRLRRNVVTQDISSQQISVSQIWQGELPSLPQVVYTPYSWLVFLFCFEIYDVHPGRQAKPLRWSAGSRNLRVKCISEQNDMLWVVCVPHEFSTVVILSTSEIRKRLTPLTVQFVHHQKSSLRVIPGCKRQICVPRKFPNHNLLKRRRLHLREVASSSPFTALLPCTLKDGLYVWPIQVPALYYLSLPKSLLYNLRPWTEKPMAQKQFTDLK